MSIDYTMPGAIFNLASLVDYVNQHDTRARATELRGFLNDEEAMKTVANEMKRMLTTNPDYLDYFVGLISTVKIDGKNLLDILINRTDLRKSKLQAIINMNHKRGGRRTKRSTRRTKRSRRAHTRRQ